MTTAHSIDPDILAAATKWFEDLEDGVADMTAFEAWRAQPSHAIAFALVSQDDNRFEVMRATSRILADNKVRPSDLPFHAEPHSELASKRTGVVSLEARRKFLFRTGIAVAGVAGIAAGATWIARSARAGASTRVGQRSVVSLPDGGRLDINTDSKVEWQFDEKARRIWLLRGEIALTVPADKRPVVLSSGGTFVALAPGSFNARLRGNALDLLVSQGTCYVAVTEKSALNGGLSGTAVSAGRAVSMAEKKPNIRAVSADEAEATSAWKNDEVIFDGLPLSAAVDEYNRYLEQKIVIGDPELNQLRILGRFTTRDPTEFLKGLEISYGLRATKSDTGAVVVTK